jgi:hypothetical protein
MILKLIFSEKYVGVFYFIGDKLHNPLEQHLP